MLQTHETNKWKEICTYSMHKQGKNRSNSTEAGEKATIFPKQKKTSKICKHVENHGKRQETHRNCRKPRKIEEGTGSKEQKMETTTQKQKRKRRENRHYFQKKRLSSGPFPKRYFGNVTMHMFLRFSSLWHHSLWLRCCHVVRNQRQTNKVELPWWRQ